MSATSSPPQSAPRIRAKDLVLRLGGGQFELHVPEFALTAGEQVALVGASGTGKSTLLAALCGHLAPASGRLELLGQDWVQLASESRQSVLRSSLGVLLQELVLIEYLSVAENALLPARLAQAGELDLARRSLDTWLSALGLEERARSRPRQLSGGERQRAALLRALLLPRPLVLLDEPTSALDPELANHTLDLLLATCRERGSTLLVVTHDPAAQSRFQRVFQTVSLGSGRAQLLEVDP